MSTPNLVPRNDNEGQIGRVGRRWAEGHFSDVQIQGSPAINQESLTQQMEVLKDSIELGAASFEADGNGDLMPVV